MPAVLVDVLRIEVLVASVLRMSVGIVQSLTVDAEHDELEFRFHCHVLVHHQF